MKNNFVNRLDLEFKLYRDGIQNASLEIIISFLF